MWAANGDTKSTFGKGGAKPLPPPLLRNQRYFAESGAKIITK